MTCEYCGRVACQAYATRDGFAVLAGDERTLAEIDCRNAARDARRAAESSLRELRGQLARADFTSHAWAVANDMRANGRAMREALERDDEYQRLVSRRVRTGGGG